MVIDANIYWLPQEFFSDEVLLKQFLTDLNSETDTRSKAEVLEDGSRKIVIEKPLGCPGLDYFQNDYQLEKILTDMDEAQVDRGVLKLPGCQEWMSLETCKLYNRAVAKVVKESHGRLTALGVVPPYGTKENLAEIKYCINELGLHGLQLSTHYSEGYLDAPVYREFFRFVAKLSIPIYVHHTPVPLEYQSIQDYDNLRRSYGRCVDQVIAISREVFSDLFAELPNLKLVHSMLGGGYFTYKNMLLPHDSGNGRFNTDNGQIKKRIENNIYYELSHAQPWGKENIEIAAKVLGAQNLIYGSSYPVKKVWLTNGPQFVEGLEISADEKQAILSRNASEIYQI